ncbi:MAG: hypothetical protein ACR2J6_00035 [Thermoleophilaceae bacterium]
MKPSEQLQWEARNGPKAAAAAFGCGAFTLVSLVIQLAFVGGGGGNERDGLVRIHENQGELLLSLVAQALSVFLLIGALFYLVRGVMARRPEGLKFLWPLMALAPVLLMVGAVLTQLDLGDIANEFVSQGHQTNARAKDLIDGRDAASGIVASVGTLCLALSYVLVSVNAMRAGLLSRFMGILGIIAGALLVIPLLPGGGSFIQLFWIVALGVLFLDRWPNGRGPAWSAVERIPWPTAAEIRSLGASKSGPETDLPPPPPPPPAGEHNASEKPAQLRSSRKKKKRKR